MTRSYCRKTLRNGRTICYPLKHDERGYYYEGLETESWRRKTRAAVDAWANRFKFDVVDEVIDDPEPVRCVDCDKPATHFTEADAPYDPHCDEHFEASFTECPQCGEVVPKGDIEQVETLRQTHWSPAEYEEGCSACIKKLASRRPLSRHERLQAAADAGYDTWAEYRGER